MSHCLSHKNKRQDAQYFPFLPTRFPLALRGFCTLCYTIIPHTFHIFWASFQSRHSTWHGESTPVEKQYHRNLIYCSYSPWQQIIMLEICGEQGSDGFSVGGPYDSKKYDQILLFLFQTVCTLCHSCFKIAFKPSVTQSMLFDVPQGGSGCPYLLIVDYYKAKGTIISTLCALQTAQMAF